MTAEIKKSQHKSRPRKPERRASAPGTKETFKETLFDSLGGDFANKLRQSVEDSQKRKIREAMSDPKVQKAAATFNKPAKKK